MKNWIFLLLSLSLYSQNQNSELAKYDFSNLWLGNEIKVEEERTITPETIGYIGSNYQRFYIKFLWVEKDVKNPNQYIISGKIMFNGYKTNIRGILVVNSNSKDENCLTISGDYYFHEGPNYELITATYKGTFLSKYILKNSKIEYCTNGFISDSYSNNQFAGMREDLINKKNETCNWGDFRIPESGDFDIGAGEFAPNQKYLESGWISYMLAHRMPYCDSNGIHYASPEVVWWKD